MNNERKIKRMAKQLEASHQMIKELKCKNHALAVENNALKNTIDTLQSTLDALNDEVARNRAEHQKALSDLHSAKSSYKELEANLQLTRKRYKKEMEKLISSIRNGITKKG